MGTLHLDQPYEPDGKWQQNLVRPCLLFLIAQRPDHGYDLLSRLRTLGIDVAERSVYRNLDSLRRQELIAPDWEKPSTGPARRVFEVTQAGMDELERTIDELRRHLDQAGDLLRQFERVATRRRWRPALRTEAAGG